MEKDGRREEMALATQKMIALLLAMIMVTMNVLYNCKEHLQILCPFKLCVCVCVYTSVCVCV